MKPRREQACEACRARKSRCLPGPSEKSCLRCEQSSISCVAHEAIKRRNPQRRKKFRFVEQGDVTQKLQCAARDDRVNDDRDVVNTTLLLPMEDGSAASDSEAFGATFVQSFNIKPFNLDEYNCFIRMSQRRFIDFLHHYQSMTKSVPFAFCLEDINVEQMVSQTPILLLAIGLTASSSDSNLQLQADQLFRHVLADRVIIRGEKRIELLHSLLTYLTWYHLRFDPESQQFYQFLQLANGMAADLQMPRRFGQEPTTITKSTVNITDARAFLQCYYLNVGGSALEFDRTETMQCAQSLRNAAQFLADAGNRPNDKDAPAVLELMFIASQHQSEMKQMKDATHAVARLRALQQSLCTWRASSASSSTFSLLAPTYYFLPAYTFLKSRSLRQPSSSELHIGLESCQAVLSHILEQGPTHLVKLGIVEWAHLITILFILPGLEISAVSDKAPSGNLQTPLTLQFISSFRSQLASLKLISNNETLLQAETLWGWIEMILMAVETRAATLSGRNKHQIKDEETAYELVNSFLHEEPQQIGTYVDTPERIASGRSKEDFWLDFMSDWLDW